MISARRRTLNACLDLRRSFNYLNIINQSLCSFSSIPKPALGKISGDGPNHSGTQSSRIDPDNALKAYDLIPPSDRSLKDIRTAINAACHQRKHALAVQIHDEAVEWNPYPAVTIALVASLLRIGQWKLAAKVWGQLPYWQRMAGPAENQDAWHEMDDLTTLPKILMQLATHLQPSTYMVADEAKQLREFSTQLLYKVFSSAKIMANITGSAILGLLDKFYSLSILRPLHYFQGIRTLNKNPWLRDRYQFAKLLYQNLNSRFPEAKLTRSVLGSLLNILCESENGYADSRAILGRFARDWGKPDEKAYQRVLSACARNGAVGDVHEVFAEYCSHYSRPANLSYLTPLLYVYARLGNVQETRKQFDRLEPEFGLKPSVYCWNVLITAHSRSSDREGAFETLKLMKRACAKPDDSTYAMLMGLCAADGDTDAVYQLMEAARLQGVRETIPMISELVQSYCHSDRIGDAETLVESATKSQLKETPTRIWNVLLRHHALRADTDAILSTQARMKDFSVPADGMTYAFLMQCLVNVRKTDEATKILRSLHFSNAVTATISHYSIILWGYASENNRDMVAVIFTEMAERFPRVGLSAKLSRLRSMIDRDTTAKRLEQDQALRGRPATKGTRLPRALDFLAETLLDVTSSDLATSSFQAGIGNRNPAEAFPSVFLESLIASFARNGAFEQVEKLLARYELPMHNIHGTASNHPPPMHLLASVMANLRQQNAFGSVEKIWSLALSLAINKGRKRTLNLSDIELDISRPPVPVARSGIADVGFGMANSTTGAMVRKPLLHEELDVGILPAHRHSLTLPLSEYMQSMSAQKCARRLPELVARLERMGFVLTSKNWNHYIQSLAYSDDEDLQMLAFSTFEKQLLPNMPVWDLLRRGKWSEQRFVDGTAGAVIEEKVERKFIERFRYETHVPTYWTMVYLALALMKFQQRDLRRETPGLAQLQYQAPGSLSAVIAMPYLREKAQGLLLRDRDLVGERQKRPRRPADVDRAGIRGSRQLLDQIPADIRRDEVIQILQRERLPFANQPEEKRRELLQLAERLTGEIRRTPLVLEAAGRYETEQERTTRLRAEEHKKLQLLQRMRDEGQQDSLLVDEAQGDPSLGLGSEYQGKSLVLQGASKSRLEERESTLGKDQDAVVKLKQRKVSSSFADALLTQTQAAAMDEKSRKSRTRSSREDQSSTPLAARSSAFSGDLVEKAEIPPVDAKQPALPSDKHPAKEAGAVVAEVKRMPDKPISDARPPAILSAARRPHATAVHYVVRQLRGGLKGRRLKVKDFGSNLQGKLRAALVAHQPPIRRTNRLLRAFTQNRARREKRRRESRSKASNQGLEEHRSGDVRDGRNT
jgi:pentatricopeptide repeat protein